MPGDTLPQGWNNTATAYERDLSIHDVWAARVAEQPDAIAIEDAQRQLSYQELDDAAARIAQRLDEHLRGAEPGVGVLAERSIDAVVAFLAALKAGAAYVPLDPCFPDERLRFMLEDTATNVVLAQASYLEQARTLGAVGVKLDVPYANGAVAEYSPRPLGPHSLVYVMYTSGTSGRPKGVAVEHRGVLRYARGARDLMPERGEGMLFVNQLGFDGSTFEIWGALLNGARLVVHAGQPTPVKVARTMLDHKATVALFPTGLFHQLVDWSTSQQDGAADVARALTGMRLALPSGDVLSPSHARRFLDLAPHCRLVNAYGPTETTVTGSTYPVTSVPDDESVPIGRPLANTTLYVLGAERQPVPDGQPGELFIGGDGVARGYLNLPDLTAERFVGDPFAETDGGRMYRTGDLVRRRADGNLEFLGRIDNQVKIRGYRVEPGEVEAILNAYPRVRQVIVLAREDIPGHKRLVAYATVRDAIGPADLRAFAADRLPQYMVPSAFVLLDEFPLTDNGKLDRRALPAAGKAPSGRAPATSTERLVAEAIDGVLHRGEVSAEDDFFELGGDSLLAIQVLSRLHRRLGVTLPMDLVFAERTVEGIAAGTDLLLAGGTVTPPLPPLPERSILDDDDDNNLEPVSPSQSLACFHSELADTALPYQAQAVIWFDGPLEPTTLEQAMTAVVSRHEILRTTFPKHGPGWVQVVHSPAPVGLPVVDLRADMDPDGAFERLKAARFGARIDLACLPIVRWTLVRLSESRWALLQVEHHVIHDGVSFTTLLDELIGTYRAMHGGHSAPLPPAVTQYRQFARWQREFVASSAGRRQLTYWTSRLAQLPPPPELPLDRPHPRTPTYRGRSLYRDLPAPLAESVRRVAAECGATPYMVMLGAFFALLHRYSGQADLLVGSGLAARRQPDLESLIGMVVNTVTLRVEVDGEQTVRELIDRVRTCCLQAQDNQELPFEEVARHVAQQRRVGRAPIYQHLFSFHDSPLPDLRLVGVRVVPEDVQSNGSAKADLNVIVVNRRTTNDPRNGALRVVWEYSSDLFDDSTGERMLSHYLLLLEAIVADPHRPVGRLRMTPPVEREALLIAARNPRPYERDASVYQIFAERVRERPDAVAVTRSGTAVTYRQLEAAAGAIAKRLTDADVAPGECVAVADDRSVAMVAALLGVLRVGAAYVGVDTRQPPARVASLLAAAGVRVACSRDGAAVPGAGVTIATTQLSDAGHAPTTTPMPGPSDLAYVSFTSGSTGEPKGVAVSHRGVVRLVRGADYVQLGPHEAVLATAPLSFDASTFEIWGALLNGARLVLASAGPLSTAEIATVLRTERVSVAWFTAAIFHEMVDHELAALCGVRQILAGGDVLSPAHVNRLLAALPEGGLLVNAYGPTEATTFTCCHRMTAGMTVGQRVPIGRPISNSAAYVVDDGGEAVPPGVLGEIWAGGDGVARGYLGRQDLTEQHFAADPFFVGGDDAHEARIYRTGDRARLRADGTLEFVGRADRQVKLRGYRVEPAETEAALLRRAGVRQAHVEVAQYGRDDRRLVAYLVGDGNDRPSDSELRRALAANLPSYLVPAAYLWLDHLPVTTTGKLDRAALATPPSSWFDETNGPARPDSTLERTFVGASKTERALVAIWQEVTGVRDVGLDDDFFDLGGHSLLAVRLFAAIERTIGARLPLSTIFSAPTVRQLADVLRSEGWDAPWGSLVVLQASGDRPPLFAITAGDGNVVGFGPLARRLGSAQPFYVLQPHGLDGKALLHRTVPSMARRYVREIHKVQPQGPYLLAGRCFGALVAVEMTRQLEARGERVALLAAIDSIGPFWPPRQLANGMAYDEVMNLARARGDEAGVTFGDVFSDTAAAEAFVGWLSEAVSVDGALVVNRYLYAAYLARQDLRAAYPLDAHGHAGLVDWAWVGGRSEMGMNPRLLATPSPWAIAARPSVDPRRTTRPQRTRERLLDIADFATRGKVPALAERRRARMLALANENVLDYRAGSFSAPVTLIRSEDDEDDTQKAQLARWYGLESGGVTLHYVRGSHSSMLREPDVASLAECVDGCISQALAGPRLI